MKTITSCLAIFVAAIVLANCDQNADLKGLMQKIADEYQKLSLKEIRAKVGENVNRFVTVYSEVADIYEKKDLVVAATWYRTIGVWIKERMPVVSQRMDKMNEKEKTMNWMEMGIAIEFIKDLGDSRPNNHTVIVVNTNVTEVEAKKVFEQKKTRVLKLTKAVADGLKKKSDKQFWSDIHQKVYDFLVNLFEKVETQMKTVTKSELRTKNYEHITAYVEGLLTATEFRAGPHHTFFAKVGQKLTELAHKISSLF